MFFLAETQIRQIQTIIDTDLCMGSVPPAGFSPWVWLTNLIDHRNELRFKPLSMREHQSQLENWHKILPKELNFDITEAHDLFEDRKAFLRMQYHCAQTLLAWPAVFALFEANETEADELLRHAERVVMVKRFLGSMLQVLQGAPEQLFRTTIMTWLICEA